MTVKILFSNGYQEFEKDLGPMGSVIFGDFLVISWQEKSEDGHALWLSRAWPFTVISEVNTLQSFAVRIAE